MNADSRMRFLCYHQVYKEPFHQAQSNSASVQSRTDPSIYPPSVPHEWYYIEPLDTSYKRQIDSGPKSSIPLSRSSIVLGVVKKD
jgi:hypothetical protein